MNWDISLDGGQTWFGTCRLVEAVQEAGADVLTAPLWSAPLSNVRLRSSSSRLSGRDRRRSCEMQMM